MRVKVIYIAIFLVALLIAAPCFGESTGEQQEVVFAPWAFGGLEPKRREAELVIDALEKEVQSDLCIADKLTLPWAGDDPRANWGWNQTLLSLESTYRLFCNVFWQEIDQLDQAHRGKVIIVPVVGIGATGVGLKWFMFNEGSPTPGQVCGRTPPDNVVITFYWMAPRYGYPDVADQAFQSGVRFLYKALAEGSPQSRFLERPVWQFTSSKVPGCDEGCNGEMRIARTWFNSNFPFWQNENNPGYCGDTSCQLRDYLVTAVHELVARTVGHCNCEDNMGSAPRCYNERRRDDGTTVRQLVTRGQDRNQLQQAQFGCSCDSEGECGDGTQDDYDRNEDGKPDEECDDGNNRDGDGCDGNCKLELCGNGNLDLGEGCENDTHCTDPRKPICDKKLCQCRSAKCGDGIIDPAAGETCDPGSFKTDEMVCNFGPCNRTTCTCPGSFCGDGIIDYDSGEECDGDGWACWFGPKNRHFNVGFGNTGACKSCRCERVPLSTPVPGVIVGGGSSSSSSSGGGSSSSSSSSTSSSSSSTSSSGDPRDPFDLR